VNAPDVSKGARRKMQARSLRGFDEDRLSILDSDLVTDYIQDLLSASQRSTQSGSVSIMSRMSPVR
jgi:hypothetical protein